MPRRVVAEGDTLELGTHTLHFVMARGGIARGHGRV